MCINRPIRFVVFVTMMLCIKCERKLERERGTPSPDEVEADPVMDVFRDQLLNHVDPLDLHEQVAGLGLGAVLQAIYGNVPDQR